MENTTVSRISDSLSSKRTSIIRSLDRYYTSLADKEIRLYVISRKRCQLVIAGGVPYSMKQCESPKNVQDPGSQKHLKTLPLAEDLLTAIRCYSILLSLLSHLLCHLTLLAAFVKWCLV